MISRPIDALKEGDIVEGRGGLLYQLRSYNSQTHEAQWQVFAVPGRIGELIAGTRGHISNLIGDIDFKRGLTNVFEGPDVAPGG